MEKVLITGTGSELQGVGRMADGRAVFIAGALPGEEAEIEITKESARWCEGRLIRVTSPSPHRVEPDCPYYGTCGGCAARHMTYAYSLQLKEQKVRDALTRIGGIENAKILPIIGCENPDRSRNKAEYAVSINGGKLSIGCLAAKSHRVINVDECLLQSTESTEILRMVRGELEHSSCAPHIKYIVTRTTREKNVCVVISCDAPVLSEIRRIAQSLMKQMSNVISVAFCRLKSRPTHALDGTCEIICGSTTIEDTLCGLKFELSPQSFFQVNPVQAEKLYSCAIQAADINDNTRIIDAYCGAGTITLSAARTACSAVGVEIVAPAIENAKRNAARNNLSKKARFICGDAAKEIPRLIRGGEHFDAAILDPPRKGADEALLRSIAEAKIPRISYVSCDPATLARDVKLLVQLGYRFEYAQPVDMFAQTAHVETVVFLSRA